jgi:PadR family transcriptional regulator, regulatory protein AphA
MNVKTLCLGILSFGEASGYEIKKKVEEGLFSHFIDASYGSIYPALIQMLAEELVTVRAEEQSGRPDKKVYAITAKGLHSLAQALTVTPDRDKFKSEFLFQMLLMELLPPSQVAGVYEHQLALLRAELGHIEGCRDHADAHPGTRFVNGYGRAVMGAAVRYLEECRDGLLNRTKAKLAAE